MILIVLFTISGIVVVITNTHKQQPTRLYTIEVVNEFMSRTLTCDDFDIQESVISCKTGSTVKQMYRLTDNTVILVHKN